MSVASPKSKAGDAAAVNAHALWVGTSGYSYPEWIEAGIYPPGTKAGQMLPLYAREFPVTELNYTWYQMPRAEAVERQRDLVPPDFLFCAKLTRTLTHEVDAKTWQDEAAKYRLGIAPLVQSRQLLRGPDSIRRQFRSLAQASLVSRRPAFRIAGAAARGRIPQRRLGKRQGLRRARTAASHAWSPSTSRSCPDCFLPSTW